MKRLLAVGIAGVMLFAASCAQNTQGAGASNQPQRTQQAQQDESDLVIGTSGVEPKAQGTDESPRGELMSGGEAQQLVMDRLGNPDQVDWLEFELDDHHKKGPQYEGELEHDGKRYEFELDAVTGEFREWEEETAPAASTQGATEKNNKHREYIGADRAKKIALAEVKGADYKHIRGFEFDKQDRDDDGRPEYEVTFVYDGVKYEAEIDAYTGEITDWDEEKVTTTKATTEPTTKATTEATTKPTTTTKRAFIGMDRAKKIALDRVSGASEKHITEVEFDRDDSDKDGRPEYEITFVYNGVEYEVEIDAYTGEITEWDEDVKETTPTTKTKAEYIGADRAKKIALAKVSGATTQHITEFEFDRNDSDDDGRPEYEITIVYGGVEYEAEIDAYTGEITEWDVEKLDNDDDRDDDDDDDDDDDADVKSNITRNKAIQIALAKVPGATTSHVEDAEYDEDDGKWEIEIEYNDAEYEITLNARGDVLDVEKDD